MGEASNGNDTFREELKQNVSDKIAEAMQQMDSKLREAVSSELAEARNKYDDEEQLTKRVEQAAAAQVDALASTFNQAAQAAVEKASAAQRASEQAAERAAEHA